MIMSAIRRSCIFLTALYAFSACFVSAEIHIPSDDPSYVVQIHSTREHFVSPDDVATTTKMMTTESGQQFECFVPLNPARQPKQQHNEGDVLSAEEEAKQEALDNVAFLTFSRAAVKKIRPKCLQYVDITESWVYEICPGILVRRISLKARTTAEEQMNDNNAVNVAVTAEGELASSLSAPKHTVIEELGVFDHDMQETASHYNDFVGADVQERVQNHPKPLFTQTYHAESAESKGGEVKVQFMCNPIARDDTVAGANWQIVRRQDGSDYEEKAVSSFLVFSRVFCDAKHSHTDDHSLFSVASLLHPLRDAETCLKRNEGWWTYEFCFGSHVRQYHRNGDGKITNQFNLGTYNVAQNEELEQSGAALVSEHIDATHDVSRAAYLEYYMDGTTCKEFNHAKPRTSKVYYYCSQGATNHHILSVKETQTCTYTIKISTPAVCDHPHFINEAQKSEGKPEVVHCIPVVSSTPSDDEHYQ